MTLFEAKRWLLCVCLLPASLVNPARAAEWLPAQTHLRLIALDEADRDLGTAQGGERRELALDIQSRWDWDDGVHWSSRLKLQGFVATGLVELDSETGSGASDGFVGVREAWLDYRGLGRYADESVRLGHDRLKEDSGRWWDEDLTLVRWRLNTTLLRATAGLGEQFSHLRTQNNALSNAEDNLLRAFGALDWQWQAGQWFGARAMQVEGHGDQAALSDVSASWLGLQAENAWFDPASQSPLHYLASLNLVSGSRKDVVNASSQDIRGWSTDLGVRLQLAEGGGWRWNAGVNWAMGRAGSVGDQREGWVETGLNSDRSRYTGTWTPLQRFGEALRPELGNLQVVTLHTAIMNGKTWDVNLAGHRYWRVSTQDDVSSVLAVSPGGSSGDLGYGLDVVATRYAQAKSGWLANGLIRLRAGLFLPGDAFGRDVDASEYRVQLDVAKQF